MLWVGPGLNSLKAVEICSKKWLKISIKNVFYHNNALKNWHKIIF